MIREDFLQQSAYSDTDSFCPMQKQYWMLRVIQDFYRVADAKIVQGASLKQVMGVPARGEIARMKEAAEITKLQDLDQVLRNQVQALEVTRL